MSLDPLIADILGYCGSDDALSICATLRSSGFGKNGCAPSSERTSLSCHRAQRLFAEMLSSTERQNKALADEWLQTAIDYKVEWEQELQRREALGITDLPDPIPHPDQVIIDMNTGMARVQGPMTKEDLAQLEHWTKCRDDWAEEVSALTEHLSSEPDEGIRKIVQADLKHARKMLETIEMALEKIGY